MFTMVRAAARRWRYLSVLIIAGVALASCSSSKSTAATTTTASGANSGAVTVMTHTGPAGTYLTDGSGKTLYLFTPDTTATSTCTGGCAKTWPPLTTTAKATAGTGVTASLLTTSKRPDGSTQVDYNSHPLYYFASDSAAGDTNGQGVMKIWWLVSPSGDAIQSTK